jgi:hypothetical protein
LALLLLTALLLLSSAGCGLRYLGESQALLTAVDQRVIVTSPAQLAGGRNVPKQILCAEPSPDVAKALSESFNISGALDAVARGRELPVEGALQAATAISRTRAEALAQLTNRLATIQLLRDSLYRACEAYSNGALSETTYAIILSRFDKLMVTMLTGELVAGNFGQSLAVLGTSAAGASHSAVTKVAQDANKVAESQKAVDDARVELETKRTAQADAVKALSECAPANTNCREQNQKVVNDRQKETAAAHDKLVTALVNAMGDVAAAASSNAAVLIAQGVGAVPSGHATNAQGDTAKTLETIQRKFLENINADPLIVACLTAFDRGRSSALGQELITFCNDNFSGVLRAQQDLLRAKLIDGQNEMVHGCLSAFKDAHSTDPGVTTAAKALKEFCEQRLVEILKIQTDLLLKEKQLEDAHLELERKRREPIAEAAPSQPR